MKFSILILSCFLFLSVLIVVINGLTAAEKWRLHGIKGKLHIIDEKTRAKLDEFIRLEQKLHEEYIKEKLKTERLRLDSRKKLEKEQEAQRNNIFMKYLMSRHNSTSLLKDFASRVFW